MNINVYCSDRGWLFEDLKQLIASKGATASEKPLDGFDAYICIRTRECKLSPKPKKTLVQVHDMNQYDLRKYGCVSIVHPSQAENIKGSMEITVIGSRQVPQSDLPKKPTLGFFCREVAKKKGSEIFEQFVLEARKKFDFDVLMIGENLKHIAHLGVYEKRPANINDYSRVTALFTASKTPMIPLSIYEAAACGRSIISTPRIWTFEYNGLFGLGDVEKALFIDKPFKSVLPYSRDEWAKRQIEIVSNLI